MIKYRLKPVGIKCNSYRTTFKHEQTGMLAGYEINYLSSLIRLGHVNC